MMLMRWLLPLLQQLSLFTLAWLAATATECAVSIVDHGVASSWFAVKPARLVGGACFWCRQPWPNTEAAEPWHRPFLTTKYTGLIVTVKLPWWAWTLRDFSFFPIWPGTLWSASLIFSFVFRLQVEFWEQNLCWTRQLLLYSNVTWRCNNYGKRWICY